MVTVSWFSPIYEVAGYSEVARNLLIELDKLGVDIRLVPEVWNTPKIFLPEIKKLIKPATEDSIHVYHKVGAGFKRSGKYTIGYTVFETTKLHPAWTPKMNIVDEIWTASSFCKKVFESSGVKKPIYVIPHGVNVQRFSPNVRSARILNKRTFSFLSVFSGTYQRKGLDLLLEAYSQEFESDEDVCLIIKFYQTLNEARSKVFSLLHGLGTPAPILWLSNIVPVNDMPKLYKAANCFVSASRGEAWDLPCSEAMAMELPVIATKWGGHLEYMNDKNSFLIDVAKIVPVNMKTIEWYQAKMNWAEPSVDHLRQLMRYVYEHPNQAEEKGKKAREDISSKFQWSHSAKKILSRLNKVL